MPITIPKNRLTSGMNRFYPGLAIVRYSCDRPNAALQSLRGALHSACNALHSVRDDARACSGFPQECQRAADDLPRPFVVGDDVERVLALRVVQQLEIHAAL